MVRIILSLLFFTVNLCAQEKRETISFTPHNYTYLIFFQSMTATNKTAIKNNLLIASKDAPQPSARFQWVYNSTETACKVSGYRQGIIKFDPSTTRVLLTVDAKYDDIMTPLITSGKARKISCLYEEIYNDLINGKKNCKIMVLVEYESYISDFNNKDWNLCKDIIDIGNP